MPSMFWLYITDQRRCGVCITKRLIHLQASSFEPRGPLLRWAGSLACLNPYLSWEWVWERSFGLATAESYR